MICGKPASDVHHIIPLSKEGRDIPENKIILCKDCHRKKGLHSNYKEYKLSLLVSKLYSENAPIWLDHTKCLKDTCTRTREDDYELPMVSKRGSKPKIKPKVLLPEMPIRMARPNENKEFRKRCDNSSEKVWDIITCPCGCGENVKGRLNKKYASPLCRYRIRNRQRYERQKEAIDLAIKILIHAGYKVVKE